MRKEIIRNLLLLALLAPFCCPGAIDLNKDSCTMYLYDLSVGGMRCEGCDKHITQSYGKEVTMFTPFGMDMLKVHMIPTRTHDVDQIDFTAAIIAGDEIKSDDDTLGPEFYRKLMEEGTESELGKKSVTIPEESSVLLTFDEFSFRVTCPRPKFLKPPAIPTIKDADGNVLTGQIYVGIDVDKNGSVTKSFTLGDAEDRLKDAAKQVLKEAGFHPPVLDGEHVKMRYAYTVVFGE